MKQVVILHGYGANADDLKPLEGFLAKEDLKFYFPEAPVDLSSLFPMMRAKAWFDIDQNRLMEYQTSGKSFDLTNENPPNLPDAMSFLEDFVERNLDPNLPIIMGGFSQGAMCTLHFFSQFIEKYNFESLVFLSGNLLAKSLLDDLKLEFHTKIPIFQSHGVNDTVLPFSGAEKLRDFLENCGYEVDFHSFNGGHEIPMDILQGLKSFLHSA